MSSLWSREVRAAQYWENRVAEQARALAGEAPHSALCEFCRIWNGLRSPARSAGVLLPEELGNACQLPLFPGFRDCLLHEGVLGVPIGGDVVAALGRQPPLEGGIGIGRFRMGAQMVAEQQAAFPLGIGRLHDVDVMRPGPGN